MFHIENQKKEFVKYVAKRTIHNAVIILDYRNPENDEQRIRFLFDENEHTLIVFGEYGVLVAKDSRISYWNFDEYVNNPDLFAASVIMSERPIFVEYGERSCLVDLYLLAFRLAKEDINKCIKMQQRKLKLVDEIVKKIQHEVIAFKELPKEQKVKYNWPRYMSYGWFLDNFGYALTKDFRTPDGRMYLVERYTVEQLELISDMDPYEIINVSTEHDYGLTLAGVIDEVLQSTEKKEK